MRPLLRILSKLTFLPANVILSAWPVERVVDTPFWSQYTPTDERSGARRSTRFSCFGEGEDPHGREKAD